MAILEQEVTDVSRRRAERYLGAELMGIYDKVMAQERLTYEDGVLLYHAPNLSAVGYLANIVRERLHGDRAYYVRNQHINYTNICNKFCKFCSFYAKKGGPAPYEMNMEMVRQKLLAHLDVPITEVHMVGGIDPRLPYQYYLDLLHTVKEARPNVHIKAFTMVELVEIQRQAKKPLEDVLRELMAAGLDSLPGGGIEILSDRVHQELFDRKLDGAGLDGRGAHGRESGPDAVRHDAVRAYRNAGRARRASGENPRAPGRDKALRDHDAALVSPGRHGTGTLSPTRPAYDDLRNIAVARLMLDNFAHIKSFWIMNTPQVTQLALWYGADDVDGTVHEYEITYKDGEHGNKSQVLTRKQMIKMIEEAGRIPIERDSLYREVPPQTEEATSKEHTFIPLPVLA